MNCLKFIAFIYLFILNYHYHIEQLEEKEGKPEDEAEVQKPTQSHQTRELRKRQMTGEKKEKKEIMTLKEMTKIK